MQALKGVVILMTLAIAVLMTLIVYGMYQKSQDPDFKFFDLGGKSATTPGTNGPVAPLSTPSTLEAANSTPQAQVFGTVTLDVPAGSTIQSASAEANRLTVVVRTPAGDEVWVVDLTNGRVLGRIRTHKAAP